MEPTLPHALSGAGETPALIVSIFGGPQDLQGMIERATAAGADVIEWRADLSDDWDSCSDVMADCELPTIATVRSDREGGRFPGRGHEYAAAVMKLASRDFDVIDVEIKRSAAYQAVAVAHDRGIPVLASYHSIENTPRDADLLDTLQEMVEAEADLLKIACMPAHADDTWRQMELSRGLKGRFGAPVISISMGADAAWTRLAAGACGSVATFASVGEGSAPGQLDARLVRSVLDALGR